MIRLVSLLHGVLVVFALLLWSGCQSKDAVSPREKESPALMGGRAAVAEGAVVGFAGGAAGGVVGGEVPPPAPPVPVSSSTRKLIRDVNATLEVKSVQKAVERLRGATQASGGYVASEGRTRDERGVNRAQLTLRIAAGKLDTIVESLSSIGTIEDIHTNASDVTEEYVDLELRLANQRRLQARLLELLDRPGNKVSDLIEAERELARVSGEIERMEGRRRFWDNHVEFATLALTLHEPLPAVAGQVGGAFAALRRSFSQAADNFVYAIAGVIAFTGALIPVAVAVLIALWIVSRLWRLRKRGRARAA